MDVLKEAITTLLLLKQNVKLSLSSFLKIIIYMNYSLLQVTHCTSGAVIIFCLIYQIILSDSLFYAKKEMRIKISEVESK